jgi:hypothetical protein
MISKMPRPAVGPTDPHMHWVPSLEKIKCLGQEVDHFLPSSFKLRINGTLSLLPLCVFMVGTETLLFPYLLLQMPLFSSLNLTSDGIVCYLDLCLGRFYFLHMHCLLSVILRQVMQSHNRIPSGVACSWCCATYIYLTILCCEIKYDASFVQDHAGIR